MDYISVDIGTSITKIIQTDKDCNILNKMILEEKDLEKALKKFFIKNNIKKEKISIIITTGVGKYKLKEFEKIPIIQIDEFIAAGLGAERITNIKNIIVASIGTGTAFIQVKEEYEIKHLRRNRHRWRNVAKFMQKNSKCKMF